MAHAKESQHFYDRLGRPAYSVKAKAGHDRPVTLADCRKLALVPGVSTIKDQAARPGLDRWKQGQVLLAALTLPRMPGEPEADWIERVWTDSREHSKQAASKGIAIHAEIEGFYREALSPVNYPREVQGVVDLLAMRFPGARWIAEQSFASPLGYGGKIDLYCDLVKVILDPKSKEFDENDDPTKFVYDEHVMQLAAYADGISPYEPMQCGNVFVSTKVPGLVHLHMWSEAELDRGSRMFLALLEYWKAKTGYDSAFSERDIEAAQAAERG